MNAMTKPHVFGMLKNIQNRKQCVVDYFHYQGNQNLLLEKH